MSGNWTDNKSLKWAGAAAILVALSALPIWYTLHQRSPKQGFAVQPVDPPAEEGDKVSCLGRIQPEDGVIHVAGPYIWGDSHAPRVESLKVQEGDDVHQGQALAVFVGRTNLEASLAQAEAQTAKARLRAEQVKAGARKPDLAAQQAEVDRLEAVAQHAATELRRYEALRATDDVTVSEVEARRNAVQVAEFAAEAARHRLESMQQVPDTDIRVAAADLAEAEANEKRARRDFEVSTIYAPADGKVLKINAREGEEVGLSGLLDMARTRNMFVIAEVYETDIGRVRVGQRATISGDLLGTTVLTGVVERIAHNVKDAVVMPGDTVSFSDKRIVETVIRLDRNEPAANLIGGKVIVVIQA
ncbi:MAG TPA: efflux RND transporter periplasmic adaptor subunit [Terracidiphilus sp.]|jgi:HlyD family secretion protein|nr:efflux RND transporter periplasmic adaptor subunit [Terracidiphilus sp.]